MRVIHIGLGAWGSTWEADVLPEADGISLVAVVDADPAVRPATPGIPMFLTLKDALRHVDADAVLVAVDIASHVPVVRRALDAGLHVLVEKPLAPDVAAARELVERAEATARVLAVAQNYRFSAPATLAADLTARQVLGPPTGLSVDFRRFRLFDDSRSRAPAFDHSVLVQIGIHHFDLMRVLLGTDATEVYCQTWNPPPSTSVAPAAAAAVVEFDGGAVATYRSNIVAAGPETPWSGRWRVECTEGDLWWEGPEYGGESSGFVELRRHGARAERVPLPELPLDRLLILKAFRDAVRTGKPPPISGRDNLGSVAILTAAIESASTHRRVAVER